MTKHFVKDGCIEIHGTKSLSTRVETFSRVLTALCFCVVWMCCDFQGLIAFHTLWDEREDSIHCVPLTQGQSAFLYHNILYYAEVLQEDYQMHICWHQKENKQVIHSNKHDGGEPIFHQELLYSQLMNNIFDLFFSIFETIFISRISSSHFNHDWI